MSILGQIIEAVLWLFLALLWARFVADWVQVFARNWVPSGPIVVGLEVVYTVTDPPIKVLRRFIPPLRIGAIALDISFLLVLLVAYVLLVVNRQVFFG